MLAARAPQRRWSWVLAPTFCLVTGALTHCGGFSAAGGASGSVVGGGSGGGSGNAGGAGNSSGGSPGSGMSASGGFNPGSGTTPSSGGGGGSGNTVGSGSSGGVSTSGVGSSGGGGASGSVSGSGVSSSGGVGGSGSSSSGMQATGTASNYELTGTWPAWKASIATKPGTLSYTKQVIDTNFYAESCSIADYNGDGNPDVSAGRRWWEGPAFTKVHIFRPGHDALPRSGDPVELVNGVSDDWADYPFDMDGDGNVDIIDIASCDANTPIAGQPKPQSAGSGYWYKNPGKAALAAGDPMWAPYLIHSDMKLEHKGLFDVNGDGKPEIFAACKGCPPGQTKGYFQGDWANPTAAWTYHPVTRMYVYPFGGTGWMHGYGAGDVNGDGVPDILERSGIWLLPSSKVPAIHWIPVSLSDTMAMDNTGNHGGSHMYAYDINGDGLTDILSTDWAHGYGLAWYEQGPAGAGGDPTFTKHYIFNQTMAPIFSEPHSMQFADMDGDGIPDIVVGKEHFAHPNGYGDPDLLGMPVLYVFKTVRDPAAPGKARFEPHLIDSEFGVGRQVTVGHLNTDGIMDICVSTKIGLAVFLGK